jgi:hypothetical protein
MLKVIICLGLESHTQQERKSHMIINMYLLLLMIQMNSRWVLMVSNNDVHAWILYCISANVLFVFRTRLKNKLVLVIVMYQKAHLTHWCKLQPVKRFVSICVLYLLVLVQLYWEKKKRKSCEICVQSSFLHETCWRMI